MNTKITYVGLSILVLLVLSGCGDKPAQSASGDNQNGNAVVSGAGGNSGNTVDPANTVEPANTNAGSTSEPTSSNTNNNNTNDIASPSTAPSDPVVSKKQSKSIDVYYTDADQMDLVQAKATISYSDQDAASKYTEAFKALQISENKELVPLWGEIKLKSLEFVNGQIVLDIIKPVEAQLGAGGESFAINALAKTMFQFEEVLSIEVLLDGEKVESLMGHVELVHPMTRDDR